MATRNGWMTAQMYHWWLENMYGCDMTTQCLLLVDNYKAHTTELSMATVGSNCISDIVFILSGCTPLVQPMDVSVNHPFKTLMRAMGYMVLHTHQAWQPEAANKARCYKLGIKGMGKCKKWRPFLNPFYYAESHLKWMVLKTTKCLATFHM